MSVQSSIERPPLSATNSLDEDVESKAQRLLAQSNYLALRRLRCEYHDGSLVLNGRVPTYYLKQVAQTIVRQLPGVRQVENRVDVAEFWN